MKKITLILSVFLLILSSQSYAQDVAPAPLGPDRIEQNGEQNNVQRRKRAHKRRVYKREVQRRKGNKRQMRAMQRIARADGQVTPRERSAMRAERRKMKQRSKRRAIARKRNIRRSSEAIPNRAF